MKEDKTVRIREGDSVNLDISENDRVLIDSWEEEDSIYITIDPQ